MSFDDKTVEVSHKLNCDGCGALLIYKPGTSSLMCIYCGAENEISTSEEQIHNLRPVDYDEFTSSMNDLADSRFTLTAEVVHCENCGANSRLNTNVTADLCAFCASPLVINHQTQRIVKPHGLIPFFVDNKSAFPLFTKWAGGLWFAPNDFKHVFKERSNRLKGVYTPFWCYDADANSFYRGARGEYYYVTRTRKGADGKSETYQERKTRWHTTSGRVFDDFEDITVSASTSLPESFASKLGPWDMKQLRPFDDQYLSGFVAETFSVNHVEGAAIAKSIMAQEIRRTVCRDIGGDEQRIDSIDTIYSNVKLKYVLLPVWISAYQYRGKNYQILINAFSGKVYGQRPYSFWKIAFAVLIGLLIIGFLILLSKR